MAKALRYAALSFLILPLAAPAIEMEGVTMVSTSGPRVVQKAQAARARLSEDGRQVLTDAIELQMSFEDGKSAVASGDQGFIVIGGEGTLDLPKGTEAPTPTQAEVLAISRDFSRLGRVGDILLVSQSRKDIATLGSSGALRSTKLLWSESYKHYVLPEDFQQTMNLPDGTTLRLEGSCAIINQDFTRWNYFGDDKEPASLEVEGKEPTP